MSVIKPIEVKINKGFTKSKRLSKIASKILSRKYSTKIRENINNDEIDTNNVSTGKFPSPKIEAKVIPKIPTV